MPQAAVFEAPIGDEADRSRNPAQWDNGAKTETDDPVRHLRRPSGPPNTCACPPSTSSTRPRTRPTRSANTRRAGIRDRPDLCRRGQERPRLDGRDALKQLIDDVETGTADFTTILVYDVSRWGRFQDADESAYYEYICKRAGISVQYCAEQFENDGSPVSTIVKGVKRAMAGEYSRELSAKVFAGQCRLIELGFRQGGPPGYGLRRC